MKPRYKVNFTIEGKPIDENTDLTALKERFSEMQAQYIMIKVRALPEELQTPTLNAIIEQLNSPRDYRHSPPICAKKQSGYPVRS